jgi:YidC/Oxa1 family membrane protein insertase
MFGLLEDVASAIMTPLYYVVSAVLLAWREVFAVFLPQDSGWTWALAIVGLAVTVRVLLIPLYLRLVRTARDLRDLEPKLTELQQKYQHDRERLTQEQMRLWNSGTNPNLWWLALFLQGLVFFVLFRVIDASAKFAPTDGSFRRGFITEDEALSLARAKIVGARLADSFLNGSHVETKVLSIVLVVILCAAQVIAQRQQVAAAPDVGLGDVFAKQQRFLLFSLLVVLAAGGLVFPLGVVIFWATSCVWTVVQQHLIGPSP